MYCHKFTWKVLGIGGMLYLTGCGKSVTPVESHYISWNTGMVRNSLIAKALEPELRICVDGDMNSTELDRVRIWAQKAALTWLRVAKVIDARVPGKVTFSCDKYHMALHMVRGEGTSHASPSVSTIYLKRPFGTWTHEFGHALVGLSDTYSGRTAGDCVSGQPESLMCWGAYGPKKDDAAHSTLWTDDINGFKANYYKIFGRDLTAPDWAGTIDLEGPIDVNTPWPEFGLPNRDPGTTTVRIDDSLPTIAIDESEDSGSIDL